MPRLVCRLFTVALLPVWLGACSTLVKGTDQSIAVSTDPVGAECRLKRRGQNVGVVAPTPGSVTVAKGSANIVVRCEKDGYAPRSRPLASSMEAMTFGNIVFGGLIGVGVDAASGAMHEYPPSITLALSPEAFPSPRERDRFYREEQRSVRRDARDTIAEVRAGCAADGKDQCERAIRKIREERDDLLAELEKERAQARVAAD